MTTVWEELLSVADLVAATGAPVTVAPAQVPVLVSKSGACVLVGAPTITTTHLNGGATVEVPLVAVMPPPGNENDLAAVLDVVERLRGHFPGVWEPQFMEVGDIKFPVFRSTVMRRT